MMKTVDCKYFVDELREAIVAMMASKDDVEEQNRQVFTFLCEISLLTNTRSKSLQTIDSNNVNYYN